MNRRDFFTTQLSDASLLQGAKNDSTPDSRTTQKFKMKFAPHIGMFTHHAGEDPIDQIKFMAEQGFTALEDNYLKRREPAEQEKIGRTLSDLNMEMGVFVGGRIQSKEPTLVTQDDSIISAFLDDIRS
ncbi:MAG: xylose isomerase, partial [Saprospiraceae bacterium]|nr:xylose isomerase [Saprospiraceae bacterium]